MVYLQDFYSESGFRRDNSLQKTQDFDSVVELVQKEYPRLPAYNTKVIETILKLTEGHKLLNRNLLDVGSGYGYLSTEAVQHGYDVTALELGAAERIISEQMIGLSPLPVPFEDFETDLDSFSVILMTQVLEHAHDVDLWISKASNLLTNDGILAIAVPNFRNIFRMIIQENDPFICPPAHLNFFTAKNLSLLLQKHGLKTHDLQYQSMMPFSTFEKRLSGLGTKGLSAAYGMATYAQEVFDILHIGMVINIYARKIEAP